MKRSGTVLIFVIVWVAVLFASFVIGICIREVRFHRARIVIETKTDTTPKVVNSKVEIPSDAEKLAQELVQKAPTPGAVERFANIPEEKRVQMREKFGGRSREGLMRGRYENLSEEERARMEEIRRAEQDNENYRNRQER